MFAQRGVVRRDAGQFRRVVDSPDGDLHSKNGSAKAHAGNVDRFVPAFVRAAPLPTLIIFISKPDSPGEEHAAPAIDDVEPVEVTFGQRKLAEFEHVNQNEKGAEPASPITTRTKLAHETRTRAIEYRIEIQPEPGSREYRKANEMAELIVLIEPKAPALRHPGNIADGVRRTKREVENANEDRDKREQTEYSCRFHRFTLLCSGPGCAKFIGRAIFTSRRPAFFFNSAVLATLRNS